MSDLAFLFVGFGIGFAAGLGAMGWIWVRAEIRAWNRR
ncbi:hypothetical protein LCGC14_0841490 [marine sediment metagenome]|uniref:Uncharacterized protein n=1 Tax=marine sediment metagenome TaxID=412755 RepID=A0A0F9PY87_9ZZZZ